MAVATQQRRELQLQRIKAALRRMENGDYGECLRCCQQPITQPASSWIQRHRGA